MDSLRKSNVVKQLGFTMVELITVIIIIGIIGSVAASKFFDNTLFQNRAASDQVKAALKYGQKIAIAQHHQVNVQISSTAQTSCTNDVISYTVSCAISSSVTPLPVGNYYFNALGEPVSSAGVVQSTPQSVTVGSTSNGGATITIEGETGYVH